uniref:Uncharacterized protein n=1 Tax=Panagrellus redivivus TaxID=6233 RepID=A0A7E4VZQ5_PANRE
MNHGVLLDRRIFQTVSATVSSVVSKRQFFRTGHAHIAFGPRRPNPLFLPTSGNTIHGTDFAECLLITSKSQNMFIVDRMTYFCYNFEAKFLFKLQATSLPYPRYLNASSFHPTSQASPASGLQRRLLLITAIHRLLHDPRRLDFPVSIYSSSPCQDLIIYFINYAYFVPFIFIVLYHPRKAIQTPPGVSVLRSRTSSVTEDGFWERASSGQQLQATAKRLEMAARKWMREKRASCKRGSTHNAKRVWRKRFTFALPFSKLTVHLCFLSPWARASCEVLFTPSRTTSTRTVGLDHRSIRDD